MHVALFVAALFASSASAQRVTSTNANGDLVIIQTTIDPDGDPVETTIQTIPGAGGGVLTTGTGTTSTGLLATSTSTTLLPTTTGTTRTTARTTNPVDPATTLLDETTLATTATRTTTTRGPQGVQGPPTTTYPPMTATTYNIEGQDYTWSNSFQSPQVATVEVPAGTIQDGAAYLSSAGAAQSANMATYGAGGLKSNAVGLVSEGALAGWVAMFVGVVTAGVGLYAM